MMSDVASRELCEELYELSGWNEAHLWHIQFSNKPDGGAHWVLAPQEMTTALASCPAYSLGYLLRKLPEGTTLRRNKAKPRKKSNWRGEWVVGIYGLNYAGVYGAGDSPEEAACKLAIELFKQGILKKEQLQANQKEDV